MGKKIKKANELNNMVIIYWVWKDGFGEEPTIKHTQRRKEYILSDEKTVSP